MRTRHLTFLIGSFILLLGGAVLLTPLMSHAQVSLGLPSSLAGLSTQDIKTSIGNIVAVIFGFLGILLVLLLLYGGFLWMTSQGNEQQIEKAKQVIISAVIGLVITLAAYSLAAFIITNVQQATGPGGPGGPPPPPPTPCPTCPTNCTDPGPGGPIKVCELKGLTAGTAGRGGTVTAVGYNFGAYDAAKSQVILQAATPVVAEFAQCNSVVQWTDNKIVFKVPSSINPGNFLVEVKNATQSCTGVGGLCQTLAVNNTSQPNLNCINPTFGPSGTAVTLEGSNFGQSQDTVEMEGANGRFSIGPSNITSWQADQIKITIPNNTPERALSGDITVKVGSQSSNGQYFTVSCQAIPRCRCS
jgi:hypothetical protein